MNLVADEAIHQKRLRRIFNKNDGIKPWYLCHVGMMEHMYKGQDVLIDAVAKCIGNGIKLELTMVGDGRLKSKLQTMVKRLKIGEYVKFIGKLPPGDAIYQVLDSADLYVLPSRQEGLPRSVIEAMARGLPCIASNVGGIPELLSVEDMVKSRDANGLAQKIAETISNPTRLREMSFRNIREAEKYRSSELIKRRVEFYKRVADGTEEHTIAKRGR
jgi:glycosyltransferase involved in cell wall biosynthesis